MPTNSDLYTFIRRLRGLPEGHRLIDHHIHHFGAGFAYGGEAGDGDGRMDFAHFQQLLELGDGEDHGHHEDGDGELPI